jgi:hypothetical protein
MSAKYAWSAILGEVLSTLGVPSDDEEPALLILFWEFCAMLPRILPSIIANKNVATRQAASINHFLLI